MAVDMLERERSVVFHERERMLTVREVPIAFGLSPEFQSAESSQTVWHLEDDGRFTVHRLSNVKDCLLCFLRFR